MEEPKTDTTNDPRVYETLPFKKLTGWIMLQFLYTFSGALLYILLEECYGTDVISSSTYKAMVSFMEKDSNLSKTAKKTYLNITRLYYEKLERRNCVIDHKNIAKWWRFATVTCYTIGYGQITPKSDHGKLVTILYASIGIPISVFMYTCASDWVTKGIRNCIKLIEVKCLKQTYIKYLNKKTALILSATFVVFLAVFSYLNTLDNHGSLPALDSCYYWFQTLTTIGYGDINLKVEHNDWFQVVLRISQVFGLGITASLISSVSTMMHEVSITRIPKVFSFKKESRGIDQDVAENTV